MKLFVFCIATLVYSTVAFDDDLLIGSDVLDDDSFYLPARHFQHRLRKQQYKRPHEMDEARLYKAANLQRPRYQDDEESTSEALLAEALSALANDQEQPYIFVDSDSNELDSGDAYDESMLSLSEPKKDETASHGSLSAHHFQYVSGGTGEGKQMIGPDSDLENKEEVKSDEDLPAYCDPPNPCPLGYVGEDCDSSRPFVQYTAEYSKQYQEQQNCMCDDDHNECGKTRRSKSSDKLTELIHRQQVAQSNKKFSAVVAKKSPRAKRDLRDSANKEKVNRTHQNHRNQRIHKALRMHVAKKSTA